MIFLLTIWAVAGLVWLAVVVRRCNLTQNRISFAVAGFATIVIGSVLGHEFFHIPAPIPITGDRVLLGLLISVFGCLYIRRRQTIRPITATDFLALCMLVVLAASALTHDWTYFDNRPVSRLLFFYLVPFSLYFVLKNTTIRDCDLRLIAVGFCCFCAYLAITAIAESRGMYWMVFPSYIRDPSVFEFLGRGRGPFMNPVSNGLFMTTGLGVAILLWCNSEWRTKTVLTCTIPLIVIGNIATLTRSVWLGMCVAVGIVIWSITNRKQKAVVFISGTVCAILMIFLVGQSAFNFKRDKHVTANEMSQSAQLRPIFAVVAWEMFKDRPLFGCGLGQYTKSKLPYLNNTQSNLPLRMAMPYQQHNVILSLLTETGLIGCGLFVLLVLKGYQTSFRLYRNPIASTWAKSYALVLIAMLTSYLINGMFHDVSIIPQANMLLFFLLSIVVSLQQGLCTESSLQKTPVTNFEFRFPELSFGKNALGV